MRFNPPKLGILSKIFPFGKLTIEFPGFGVEHGLSHDLSSYLWGWEKLELGLKQHDER
jgi:hypothetical protein